MSQQPESTSSTLVVNPGPLPVQQTATGPVAVSSSAQHEDHAPQRIPSWLIRVELFLRVTARLCIGLVVFYVPWSPIFWDQNPLFLEFPALGAVAGSGVVRGIVSGLGLLNLWIALQDVLRHRRD